MQLADIFTKALDANQFEYLRGKLGIRILVKLWQLKWSGKGNKNSVFPLKRKSHINDKSLLSIGTSIYAISTRYLNTTTSIFIKLYRSSLLGQ
jgi:hypothetical protein